MKSQIFSLCLKSFFFFNIAVTTIYAKTDEKLTIDCDGLYYFADAKGISISCNKYPHLDVVPTLCFKDLWWKYLVYQDFGQPFVGDFSPFNMLDLDICKKNVSAQLM